MVGTDLNPGDRVEFLGYNDLSYGTIVAHCPDRGGYWVLPDYYDSAYGFGYNQLQPPGPPPETLWQRLDSLELPPEAV